MGEMMQLLSHFYAYLWRGWQNNCNSYLFDDKIRVLVDPGHLFNFQRLLESLKEDGFNAKDINLIVNTHFHPDHIEANKALRELSAAKIASHPLEEKNLGEAIEASMLLGYRIPRFNVDFNLGDKLSLGNIVLEIIHTPGHSPGSICIYWRAEKALLTGDLLFLEGVGRTDLPGGNNNMLRKSLTRISELDLEYIFPGHGPIVEGAANVKQNFETIKKWCEIH